MVFCGKPSKACHECRKRKTRCDAKPDGCSQCARAGRECPGYRRQADIIFRDQSQNVIRKAKKREAQKVAARQKEAEEAENQPSSTVIKINSSFDEPDVEEINGAELIRRSSSPSSIVASLDLPVEDKASCYFIMNYAIGTTVPGYGEFNSFRADSVSSMADHTLENSIKAASLAAYANHTRSQELSDASRMQYAKAIRLTNAALSSPADAKKDSTLLSVILLGLYEIFTGRNSKSMVHWSQHVHGAAALLKLRGIEQLSNPTGRRIFVQAVSSLLASCLQRDTRVPAHIVDMMYLLGNLTATAGTPEYAKRGIRVVQCMIDYNEFKCSCDEGLFPDLREVIARARIIDRPFADLFENTPPSWRYSVYDDDSLDPDIVFHGRYHVYWDDWPASMWNNVRLFRIMLHQHIRDAYLAGFKTKPPTFVAAAHTAEFQRSTEICYQMQAEMLASVPHALGYVKKTGNWYDTTHGSEPTPSTMEEAERVIDSVYDTTPPRSAHPFTGFSWENMIGETAPPSHKIVSKSIAPAFNGFTLMWPLWYCGFLEFATNDIRKYCISHLRRIGFDMGVRQALVMADSLESRVTPDAWQGTEKVGQSMTFPRDWLRVYDEATTPTTET